MNKEKSLRHLKQLLSQSNFVVYPKMIEELLAIIAKSGVEKKVFTTLISRLEFLSNHKQQTQLHHKEFELIGDGIYSMHIDVNQLNIRILYSFKDSDTVLLLAFFERGGKNHTDYTPKIPEAKRRLREF